jgi:hypothetical protein
MTNAIVSLLASQTTQYSCCSTYRDSITGFLDGFREEPLCRYIYISETPQRYARLLLKCIIEMANEQTLDPGLAQIMLPVELDKLPPQPLQLW